MAIVGDIEKAFLMVHVTEEDRGVLRFLRGLHTTNLSLQTRVGKLKLVCVNGTKTVGKHGKLLATNRTCLYSRQLFRQLFRVGKLEFDV